jgi:hypothetical protein
MEYKDKIEQVSNPIDYLQKNSYGLYYGDDSEGFYELDWYETADTLLAKSKAISFSDAK